MVCKLFDALLSGLEDYTLDQRGDVGSWVRMACIKGLTAFSEMLFLHPASANHLPEYLPANKYHAAICGILKQGVERLDVVRQVAGQNMSILLQMPPPSLPNSDLWNIDGAALMKDLFLRYNPSGIMLYARYLLDYTY